MGPVHIVIVVLLVIIIVILIVWIICEALAIQSIIKPLKPLQNDNVQGIGVINNHGANALVLSCMDYRFISATIDYLYGRNNRGDFDYFVLAGASLGYNQSKQDTATEEVPGDKPNSWYKTYEDHIRLAIQLHHITEIIVIDHMDCGYYASVYGDMTVKEERKRHRYNIKKFIRTLKNEADFSSLKYTGLLLRVNKDSQIVFNVVYEDNE